MPYHRRGTQPSGATDRGEVGGDYRAALVGPGTTIQHPQAETDRSREKPSPPWDALLAAVSLYVLTAVGRIQQLFPEIGPLRPTLIAGILCIVLLVLSGDKRRSIKRLRHPITWYALTMLALMAASVPFSIYPGQSLTFLYDDFAKTIVLFLVVAGSVRSYVDVRRLSLVFLLAATIYCTVLVVRTGGVGAERMTRGYTYDPNDIALFVVTALPFAFFAVASARRVPARLFGIYALAVSVVVFLKTGSRGGFLAGVVVILFFSLLNRAVSRKVRIAVVSTVVVLVAFLGTGWYWEQNSTLRDPGQDYNLTSETGRIDVWKRGIGYMLSRPLTGVGAANFTTAEGRLSGIGTQLAQGGMGWKWSTAHNSFVQVGAELGVPGLIAFMILLWQILRTFFRAARPGRQPVKKEVEGLAFAGAGGILGFTVAGFFLSQSYSVILYTLAGIAVGLAKVSRTDPPDRSGYSTPTPRAPSRGGWSR